MKYLLYYLIGVNIISFLMYGIDKYAARKRLSRISEIWLMFLSIIGGCFGSIIGMFSFRHKTKKVKFYLWNIINLGIWLCLLFRYMK